MSVTPLRDRRAERVAATRQEILDAAWELAREQGLGALSMRDLGAQVGMRAQSLYGYFPSKLAIYDAMFAAANEELLERIRGVPATDDPEADLRARAQVFVDFAVADLARYQLLFQRTIPGFVPSAAAYAPAQEIVAGGRAELARCGIVGDEAFDAWTALISGLTSQQNANDPGGDRYVRLLDSQIDMFLAHYSPPGRRQRKGRT